MAMPIERKNSFHLLLSDDELKLLRLLAEQEGLNASDYLRSMIRRAPSVPTRVMTAIKTSEMLGIGELGKLVDARRPERSGVSDPGAKRSETDVGTRRKKPS
jgi:hypothetical protein